MRRAAALLLALGIGLPALLVGVAAGPAWAHASMTGSSPEQGERLDALPDRVTFEFSEEMDPTAYVVVTGPDGSSLAAGEPVVDGSTITQSLAGPGPDGGYLMAVKAVSSDGHAVTGRVEFVVGDGELPSADGADTSSPGASASAASDGTTEAGASAAPATAAPPSAGDGGRPAWVWAVGPLCLAGSLGLWIAARRSPATGRPGS